MAVFGPGEEPVPDGLEPRLIRHNLDPALQGSLFPFHAFGEAESVSPHLVAVVEQVHLPIGPTKAGITECLRIPPARGKADPDLLVHPGPTQPVLGFGVARQVIARRGTLRVVHRIETIAPIHSGTTDPVLAVPPFQTQPPGTAQVDAVFGL